MLEFVRGNPESPTGNLIAYCNVHGDNPVEPEARYIACNVVVSFLGAEDRSFPVVIFPPVGVRDRSELKELLTRRKYYDIIRIEDYRLPPGHDENQYVKERLDAFNETVMEYVELCKDNIDARKEDRLLEMELDPGNSLSDEERTLNRLEATIQASSVNTEGSTEGSSARTMELPRSTSTELTEILRYIRKTYPRYDVHNLERSLKLSNQRLNQLYLKKFRAIFHEKYEEAATLQHEIKNLES